MEMYQLADELSYITGVAGVCFAITLVVRPSLCISQYRPVIQFNSYVGRCS